MMTIVNNSFHLLLFPDNLIIMTTDNLNHNIIVEYLKAIDYHQSKWIGNYVFFDTIKFLIL